MSRDDESVRLFGRQGIIDKERFSCGRTAGLDFTNVRLIELTDDASQALRSDSPSSRILPARGGTESDWFLVQWRSGPLDEIDRKAQRRIGFELQYLNEVKCEGKTAGQEVSAFFPEGLDAKSNFRAYLSDAPLNMYGDPMVKIFVVDPGRGRMMILVSDP